MHRSLRRAAGALALLALAAVPPAAASAAPTKTKTKTKAHYLLSLGDSLSVGVQPNAALALSDCVPPMTSASAPPMAITGAAVCGTGCAASEAIAWS